MFPEYYTSGLGKFRMYSLYTAIKQKLKCVYFSAYSGIGLAHIFYFAMTVALKNSGMLNTISLESYHYKKL